MGQPEAERHHENRTAIVGTLGPQLYGSAKPLMLQGRLLCVVGVVADAPRPSDSVNPKYLPHPGDFLESCRGNLNMNQIFHFVPLMFS